MIKTRHDGVYQWKNKLFTKNLVRGERVYGEKVKKG